MPENKSRGWVFTINNFTPEEVEKVVGLEAQGVRCSEEVGESGTPHLQGAVYFRNARAFGAVKRMLGGRAHLEKMKGSWQDQSYCIGMQKVPDNSGGFKWMPGKPGWIRTIRDDGTGPAQGTRGDLLSVKRMIDEGMTTEEVLEADFETASRCIRALDRYQDHKRSKLGHRTWMTKGRWIHGPTGCGKSHMAFEGFSDETHYVYEVTDKGWWDGYLGQEVVILNDFRGEIKYSELLGLIDKWPKKVPRRGRPPTNFLAKEVIITSSLSPEACYHNRNDEDMIAQLLRRIEVIELTDAYEEPASQTTNF